MEYVTITSKKNFMDKKLEELESKGIKDTYGSEVDVVVTVNGAYVKEFIKLVSSMKMASDPGHSFSIIVDPDNKDYQYNSGMDGDGSDRIIDIKIDEVRTKE